MCHDCYGEVNNNDDEDQISLEEHSNDEANNTIEDLEAKMLFDMYHKEKF